jgi:hypothetical protein
MADLVAARGQGSRQLDLEWMARIVADENAQLFGSVFYASASAGSDFLASANAVSCPVTSMTGTFRARCDEINQNTRHEQGDAGVNDRRAWQCPFHLFLLRRTAFTSLDYR